jgi:hypothetical protein
MGKDGEMAVQVENENLGAHHPSCMMAHDFLNRLTVIIGSCDLLQENAKDPECIKRLAVIRDIAMEMAVQLNEHQCHLDELMKAALAARRRCPLSDLFPERQTQT